MSRDPIVEHALSILACQVREADALESPDAARDYVRLQLGDRAHEVFACLFLDVQNRVIDYQEIFWGTLTQTSVYPREVLIEALACQASAVILAHNHPSGSSQPSRADEMLTQTLKTALALVDVRVIDHLIVTRSNVFSLAEKGLL